MKRAMLVEKIARMIITVYKCAGIATVDVSEVTLDNLPINVKTESKCEVLSK